MKIDVIDSEFIELKDIFMQMKAVFYNYRFLQLPTTTRQKHIGKDRGKH